jgi:hypothetical protein
MRYILCALLMVVASTASAANWFQRNIQFNVPAGASSVEYQLPGGEWQLMTISNGVGSIVTESTDPFSTLKFRVPGVAYSETELDVTLFDGDFEGDGEGTITYSMGSLSVSEGVPVRSYGATGSGGQSAQITSEVLRGVGAILGVEDLQVLTGELLDKVGGIVALGVYASLAIFLATIGVEYLRFMFVVDNGLSPKEERDVQENKRFLDNERERAAVERRHASFDFADEETF